MARKLVLEISCSNLAEAKGIQGPLITQMLFCIVENDLVSSSKCHHCVGLGTRFVHFTSLSSPRVE